jgi:RNA-directed DNA polymerase
VVSFDNMSHEWMMKFVEHRVADQRILRLIRKWLQAGVSEEGQWSETKVGTPQGAVISPLLANIYLHYVFDLWVRAWRDKVAGGNLVVVRYADDLVVGFQERADAERFLKEFRERLARFGLELHPEKTRLIEFGRFAGNSRERRGEGKPETFTFLGFTHYCGRTRNGSFTIWRRTAGKRLRAKLSDIQQTLRSRMHEPVGKVGEWLRRVVNGYYLYHAVPGNLSSLGVFRYRLCRMWRQVLRRRSQKRPLNWENLNRLFERWLPHPRVLHPYPGARFDATHRR